MPTLDVMDLLDYLKIDKPIVLVGHSLGGYTSLNIINQRKDIDRAVVIAPFIDMKSLLNVFTKSNFITKHLLKYEKKVNTKYYPIDNIKYLKNTKDKLFIIQSDDDGMIPYSISLQVVESLNNPNLKLLRMSGRKHNPTYKDSAVKYMSEVFGSFELLIKNKVIKTKEDRIDYFKNVSIDMLTEQDENLYNQIIAFIEQN